jgi:low molecular weight phosphotyrosine protein phosphatase
VSQLRRADFDKFDYIFAMDWSNLSNIEARQPSDSKAQVMLFGEWSGKKPEPVEDPWGGGRQGFERAYEQCSRFSKNFLDSLVQSKTAADDE